MATVKACEAALAQLAAMLDAVDPEARARHVPTRRVACHLSDLGCVYVGRIDPDGVHDVRRDKTGQPSADVHLTMTSDELVALAAQEDDFLHAWLRGRIHISAGVRDLLRLRSLFGL